MPELVARDLCRTTNGRENLQLLPQPILTFFSEIQILSDLPRTLNPAGSMVSKTAGADAVLIRKAFVMAVIPGKADEYAKRHSQFWPELGATLKAHGVHSYTIFYYPTTRQVFAYVEIEDEARWTAIASTEICNKWWEHMSEIMPSHADKRPACANLSEVYHLD